MPGETERLQYVQKWNAELQVELRLAKATVASVVKKSEGFSFAYLKELFVASMAQWMSAERATQMDEVVLQQLKLLRGQMSGKQKEKGKKPDKRKAI